MTTALLFDRHAVEEIEDWTERVPRLGRSSVLWIDLERHVHVILLSNRVHPSRDNEKIRDFRPVLHDAIMQVVLGESQ